MLVKRCRAVAFDEVPTGPEIGTHCSCLLWSFPVPVSAVCVLYEVLQSVASLQDLPKPGNPSTSLVTLTSWRPPSPHDIQMMGMKQSGLLAARLPTTSRQRTSDIPRTMDSCS
jgi:hypothetical protein